MAHRLETVQHLAEHALRRRVGGQQLGMRGFDVLQLAEQSVVLGIRDRRRVEHVVEVGVVVQRGAQFGGARGGVVRTHAAIVGERGALS